MAQGGIVAQGTDAIDATGAALTYFVGQCTRWVSEQVSWIPGGLGNAFQWLGNAQARGLPTTGPTLSPPPGSVAVWGPGLPGSGGFGHVAEVLGDLPGGGFQVSEENFLGAGRTDIRNVTDLSNLSGFILPPGGSLQAGQQLGAAAGGAAGGAAAAGLSTAGAIAGLPASVGHGLAGATSATVTDIATFARNNIVGLVVALVIALVIFGGKEA